MQRDGAPWRRFGASFVATLVAESEDVIGAGRSVGDRAPRGHNGDRHRDRDGSVKGVGDGTVS
jgi:hypothetical protein